MIKNNHISVDNRCIVNVLSYNFLIYYAISMSISYCSSSSWVLSFRQVWDPMFSVIVFCPMLISSDLRMFCCRFPVSSSQVTSFLVFFLLFSFPPIPLALESHYSVRAIPNSSGFLILFLLTASFTSTFPALLHPFRVLPFYLYYSPYPHLKCFQLFNILVLLCSLFWSVLHSILWSLSAVFSNWVLVFSTRARCSCWRLLFLVFCVSFSRCGSCNLLLQCFPDSWTVSLAQVIFHLHWLLSCLLPFCL